jgi:hypothetical protein
MALTGDTGILPELDESTKDFFDLPSQYYIPSSMQSLSSISLISDKTGVAKYI